MDGTLALDVTFRGSLGQSTLGRDGWRGYRDQIRRGAPDFHNEVLDLMAADGRAASRLRFTGTHRGTLLDLSATGRAFTYNGAAFFTFADDLISDIWVIGDLDSLRRQLQ